MRNLAVLLLIGLTVYCVFDIVRSSHDERLGVHPALWVLLVLLVPLVGVVVWLAVRWSRRTAYAGQAGGTTGGVPRRQRTAGPDDDPDFLRGLDEDRRRADGGSTSDGPPAS